MLKRRMWKVTIVHFALTVLAILIWNYCYVPFKAEKYYEPAWVWHEAERVGSVCVCILQPQFWLMHNFPEATGVFSRFFPLWLQDAIFLASIPLWSICFGWLFVKFDNWLNHFPFLGKRVF